MEIIEVLKQSIAQTQCEPWGDANSQIKGLPKF